MRQGLRYFQQQRRFCDQAFVLVLCILLLPLPVPTVHRHESFEDLSSLTAHLSLRHANEIATAVDLGEVHWHFEIPSQRGSESSSDHGGESDLPPVPCDNYIAGQHGVASSLIHQFPGSDTLVGLIDSGPNRHAVIGLDRSLGFQSRAALELNRSALSCVMRC